MFIQLALGSAIILITILIGGLGVWALETRLLVGHAWLVRPPHRLKMMVVLSGAAIAVMVLMSSVFSMWKVIWLEPAVVFKG